MVIARLHGQDGEGEEARILRQQATLVENLLQVGIHADKLHEEILLQQTSSATAEEKVGFLTAEVISISNCEKLRGAAERLRRKLESSQAQSFLDNEEEAYDNLVNPFYR